jgi:hypothetical protein
MLSAVFVGDSMKMGVIFFLKCKEVKRIWCELNLEMV